MIVAIEGPDLAGKSTFFERLRPLLPHAKFVNRLPAAKELMPHFNLVEERNIALWRALYDPTKLYVCDRHFTVSSPVYDSLYGRPPLDVSGWKVFVIYLRPSLDELLRRYELRGDELFDASRFSEALALYDKVVSQYKFILNPMLAEAIQWIERNFSRSDGSC